LFRLLLGIALGIGISTPTGLSGLNPMAYFTAGKALFGHPEFELNLYGAV
jgi:hypothetical protein